MIAPLLAALAIGIAIGWSLRAYGPPRPATLAVETAPPADSTAPTRPEGRPPRIDRAVATSGSPMVSAALPGGGLGGAIDVLHRRALRVPIDGVNPESFKGGFTEHRAGAGGHEHQAVDILSPRNTPIHAAEDGTIEKLFDSRAGGHTIYQFDSTRQFCYYYAHLERYAEGLHAGQHVSAGDVIGYVGTSGNAPPGTPHLHFAVYVLGDDKRWSTGQAIDPYLVFRK
jgi:murein DD-endopeptidase MepM/ murein hydrolase activator NlpD